MANYLTMYSLYQRTKNAQEELQLRKQLIYQGKGQKYIQGKLDGHAVRIPTVNVSVVDLVIRTKKETSISEINEIILNASKNEM